MWRRFGTVIAVVLVVLSLQSTVASASPTDVGRSRMQEIRVQHALKPHGSYAVAGDAISVSRGQLRSAYAEEGGQPRLPAVAGTPPWKPCGLFDKKAKLLKDYGRQKISGVSGKTGHLRCGHQDFLKASGWGLRHIESGHLSQWKSKAAMLGDLGRRSRTGPGCRH